MRTTNKNQDQIIQSEGAHDSSETILPDKCFTCGKNLSQFICQMNKHNIKYLFDTYDIKICCRRMLMTNEEEYSQLATELSSK